MTQNDIKLCMGCMNPIADGVDKCPVCGYQVGMPHNLTYLEPGTILKERYLLGQVIEKNSEGATYISYDKTEDKKVLIREFLPVGIAERNESNQHVRSKTGLERQYKTALSDFVELSRQLLAMEKVTDIVPVLDRFVDNDTVYVVYRYIRGLTLSAFLQRNGGELTWMQTKKMFMPIMNALAQLHKKGIIHRGISPDTIIVDQDRKLWLTGFCIADVRTDNSDMGAELFQGYSAPEQYMQNGWQGAWTDVYSICAVLYRTLTGARPSDGNSRRLNDDLCLPNALNAKIPSHISDAIIAGMTLSNEKRLQSIDSLTGLLLEEGDTHTAVFESSKDLELKKKKRAQGKKELNDKQKRNHMVILAMVVTMVVLLGIMTIVLVAMGVFQKDSGNSRPSQSIAYLDELSSQSQDSGATSPDGVPNFSGKDINAIKADSTYTNRFEFIIKEEYNEEYSKNVVFSQQPAANTPMPNKGSVILYVSKGSEMVAMPGLVGSTLEFATKNLSELEIKYEVISVVDSSAESGQVLRTNPSEGEIISKKTSVVYLYIKDASAGGSTFTPGDPAGVEEEDD